MERRDYLQRLVEQVAEAVARIAGKKREEPQEAVRAADRALSRLTGLPLAMLLKLGAPGVMSLLGKEKARSMLPLLEATAEALEAAGRAEDARALQHLSGALSKS